ncbi:hypothetical protein [Occallatibacter riparius]|uniref:TrbI/VirB10 family protein n=1 Tax=Occallatibacter riparius TaxID=1002689 RepID=A0A9J7BP55_9BACT|nr:hypothetical protein [Occallatibacter riparius]UWZ84523.1 hypothetical protein MOP44_00980 [Occallatibacter riparius]
MKHAGSMLRWGGAPVLALVVLALSVGSALTGCRSQQEKALDEAKKQAAASGQPQQVVSVDKDGTTTTTVIQPAAQGQTQPTITTTMAPAPAGQPKPAPMAPKVSPVAYQSDPAQQLADDIDQSQQQKPSAGQAAGQPAGQQAQYAGQPTQQQAAPAPVTIPAGTSLAIRMDQAISVKTARPGDRFTGEVVNPVADGYGNIIVPKLTRVNGVVDAAHKRGHFKGASVLELRLTSMNLDGHEMAIETRDFAQSKKGKGKRSAAMIGGGTGLGMLIGGVATGGAGLLWGGLAGAGAGTAAAGLTGNRDLVIPAETVVHFKLSQDVVVQK